MADSPVCNRLYRTTVQTLSASLSSIFFCCAYIPLSGKVIFTSSGVGVTGFVGITPYASTKGALEALAKCLNLEYASYGVSFHIIHPPLTRTKSAAPLPVLKEFMADPKKAGYGIAKHIFSKRVIICHSFGQKIQTLACYFFPVKMGRLMSKMALRFMDGNASKSDRTN